MFARFCVSSGVCGTLLTGANVLRFPPKDDKSKPLALSSSMSVVLKSIKSPSPPVNAPVSRTCTGLVMTKGLGDFSPTVCPNQHCFGSSCRVLLLFVKPQRLRPCCGGELKDDTPPPRPPQYRNWCKWPRRWW